MQVEKTLNNETTLNTFFSRNLTTNYTLSLKCVHAYTPTCSMFSLVTKLQYAIPLDILYVHTITNPEKSVNYKEKLIEILVNNNFPRLPFAQLRFNSYIILSRERKNLACVPLCHSLAAKVSQAILGKPIACIVPGIYVLRSIIIACTHVVSQLYSYSQHNHIHTQSVCHGRACVDI